MDPQSLWFNRKALVGKIFTRRYCSSIFAYNHGGIWWEQHTNREHTKDLLSCMELVIDTACKKGSGKSQSWISVLVVSLSMLEALDKSFILWSSKFSFFYLGKQTATEFLWTLERAFGKEQCREQLLGCEFVIFSSWLTSPLG